MDTDCSGTINVVEFHRYFGWKRGVFTERIFDTYSAAAKEENDYPTETDQEKDEDGELSYEEFLVAIWNYSSYDARLMAQYLFNIFDIDGIKTLSTDECNAMLRMVYYNLHGNSCDDAMATLLNACEGSTITLESFIDLVVNDNSVIQPAFDIQARIIEKTTGDKKSPDGEPCWKLYRKRRLEKFGTSEIPGIDCAGKGLLSSARFENADKRGELGDEFLSSLFQRVERHLEAPEGFDARLEEERFVDKLRDALSSVETTLSKEDFIIDRVEERKELRRKMWKLLHEIKVAHVDALYAELERDLDIWDRSNKLLSTLSNEDADGGGRSQPMEYSSEDEIRDLFDHLVDQFNSKWSAFVDSYEERFGPAATHWEKLYDADQNLSFFFQWQTGERCYDQQVGNQTPAICEVCDCLIELTDYKCFNCDAPRSERNKKKYRGRVSLENMEVSKVL